MSAPTPAPWKYGHLGFDAFWIGPDYDQTPVATVAWDTDEARDNARDNAANIVRCVNSHEALVEALRPFADIGVGTDPEYQPMIRLDREAILAARAAVDLAGGSN